MSHTDPHVIVLQEAKPMRRNLSAAIALVLLISGCGEAATEEAATTTDPAESTSSSAASPVTTVQVTTTSSTNSTITLAGIEQLEVGLFCRDLHPQGYSYADAVAYWTREGQPDRMDADGNGIPCETVYEPAAVLAFWGDPLPTTTTTPPLTLESLEVRLTQEWPTAAAGSSWGPVTWACETVTGGPLLTGSVVKCLPADVPAEGQHPIITVLILDEVGTFAVSQSGIVYPMLDPETVVSTLGPGRLCREIADEGSELSVQLPEPGVKYFGTLLYWFMEGRPTRMDADGNGVPCDTLFPEAVVDAVRTGGWIEG